MSKNATYGEAAPCLRTSCHQRLHDPDAHVVRHHVDEETHPVLAERVGQGPEGGLAAEGLAQLSVVGDVVPVRIGHAGLEDW
jgi:hypothetical protein